MTTAGCRRFGSKVQLVSVQQHASIHVHSFRGYSALCCRLFAIAFVEAIDSSSGVDQFLLTCEERMTGGADFHVDVGFLSRSCLKRLAASASHGNFGIFGVNSWFHLLSLCLS